MDVERPKPRFHAEPGSETQYGLNLGAHSAIISRLDFRGTLAYDGAI